MGLFCGGRVVESALIFWRGKMAAVLFDTYKFVDKLEKAGVSSGQAKAEVEALSSALAEALDSQLTTKSDLNKLTPVRRKN
jgi:hypothetical protein